MDQADVDCASCGYEIKDFSNVIAVPCGHGVMHYNCSYFNNECDVCESKLTIESDQSQFRARALGQDGEGLTITLFEISQSLNELKTLMKEQKHQHLKTQEMVEELKDQLKAKDDKVIELQKEIYELKLEKVESLKNELIAKLKQLDPNP